MNAHPVLSNSTQKHRFSASRTLVIAFALCALGSASRLTAESHAVIPNITIGAPNRSVAVDSIKHWTFTNSATNQIQVSFVANGAWATATLGSGRPVQPNTRLYVDNGYHYLYYVGTDSRVWCWLFNGANWQNISLSPNDPATDLVAVDSSFHFLWFRNGSQLRMLSFNGSAWVATDSGVNDYAANLGGVVDDISHTLYWNDSTSKSLRRLVWTGRDYLSATQTLDADADTFIRPAVYSRSGDVYSADGTTERLFRYVPGFHATKQNVGPALDIASPNASLAVNPINGRVFYNRFNGSSHEISIITPNAGTSDTWPRTTVTGTVGNYVNTCAMDLGNGWYFYTTSGDNLLHIIF